MSIRPPGTRWHACHEVHMLTRARDSHVSNELVRHASRRRDTGLTWVVGHIRSHRMARGGTWMLLHPTRMRRKRGSHTSHHLRLVDYPQSGYRRWFLRAIAYEAGLGVEMRRRLRETGTTSCSSLPGASAQVRVSGARSRNPSKKSDRDKNARAVATTAWIAGRDRGRPGPSREWCDASTQPPRILQTKTPGRAKRRQQ